MWAAVRMVVEYGWSQSAAFRNTWVLSSLSDQALLHQPPGVSRHPRDYTTRYQAEVIYFFKALLRHIDTTNRCYSCGTNCRLTATALCGSLSKSQKGTS